MCLVFGLMNTITNSISSLAQQLKKAFTKVSTVRYQTYYLVEQGNLLNNKLTRRLPVATFPIYMAF